MSSDIYALSGGFHGVGRSAVASASVVYLPLVRK
jgi:DNA gyrase/topoisomerase IV subunit B